MPDDVWTGKPGVEDCGTDIQVEIEVISDSVARLGRAIETLGDAVREYGMTRNTSVIRMRKPGQTGVSQFVIGGDDDPFLSGCGNCINLEANLDKVALFLRMLYEGLNVTDP